MSSPPCKICSRCSLSNFMCRCGEIVCAKHRFYINHECDYDYKKEAREKIRRENPKVISVKVSEI